MKLYEFEQHMYNSFIAVPYDRETFSDWKNEVYKILFNLYLLCQISKQVKWRNQEPGSFPFRGGQQGLYYVLKCSILK